MPAPSSRPAPSPCRLRPGSRRFGLGALVVAAVFVSAPGAWAASGDHRVARLVEATLPAVVTVLADRTPRAVAENAGDARPDGSAGPEGPAGGRAGQDGDPSSPDAPDGMALGSGFLIDASGGIVTNDHVIDGAARITVRLSDDREFEAQVVGVDPATDLALLRIAAQGLPHLTFGDSDKLRVGDDVIAVGDPFGLGGTVTRGIVSALKRSIDDGPYVDFIQTDAAINHGNSGGPLLDLDGRVIGVNSALFSPNGGNVGVGFAIPSNTVRAVAAALAADGAVTRGWLGVTAQDITPGLAAAMGLGSTRGAIVADTDEGGPASGLLLGGDVIVAFDGAPVRVSRDLPRMVADAKPGAAAKVAILRDGAPMRVEIVVGALDDGGVLDGKAADAAGAATDRIGATLAAITPALRAELGLTRGLAGVVVATLRDGGPSALAGLQVGDVITRIGAAAVASPDAAETALAAITAPAALLRIERGGARLFVGVPLG